MATILIPGPLKLHTQGAAEISTQGATVGAALQSLSAQFQGLGRQLFNEAGELHKFVNIFLNNDDIRMFEGLATPVGERDTIEILPAIAGGNNFADYKAKLNAEIPAMAAATLAQTLASASGPQVLDVRTDEERAQGFIKGSLHIDRGYLEMTVERQLPDKSADIVVYCASGVRSLLAAASLRSLGYDRVVNLAQGFEGWKAAGLPFEQEASLNQAQRRRYLRHLNLPEVGVAGQVKLLKARVLCIGAGGLGSPVLTYLAAAGVGTLGVVDDDRVDESNLQRQIIHSLERVGEFKASSARAFIAQLNPDVQVIEHRLRLAPDNVLEIFNDYDVIIDGTDNFPTRYLVNDACVQLGKPLVHGSVFRFEGQVSVFWPGRGPCYRCLYPAPPAADLAPSCSEAGVLGVLPGAIGIFCAIEALKIVLDIGTPLIGKLLSYSALDAGTRTLNIHRDTSCPCCTGHMPGLGLSETADYCSA